METTENKRDFTTVSPSAKALLLMKGLTDVPFAREAVAIMKQADKHEPDYQNRDLSFWLRVTHMEVRYKSIDRLLEGLHARNILELSSGFSFRGLDRVQKNEVHYIDTDLPEVIQQKKEFLALLQKNLPPSKGVLELLPLNALDDKAFAEIISRFPEGPITIVNEGLLMYLNAAEKEHLCRLIHGVLKQRGGCWITADIYIRMPGQANNLEMKDKFQEFLEQHRIEDNKFDSIAAAETFFNDAGFIIDKEADPDYASAGSLKYVFENATPEQLEALKKQSGRINTTWRLKPAD